MPSRGTQRDPRYRKRQGSRSTFALTADLTDQQAHDPGVEPGALPARVPPPGGSGTSLANQPTARSSPFAGRVRSDGSLGAAESRSVDRRGQRLRYSVPAPGARPACPSFHAPLRNAGHSERDLPLSRGR